MDKTSPKPISNKIQNYKLLLLSSLIYLIFPSISLAATLYLLPQAVDLSLGESALVELRLEARLEEINAAEVSLYFPEEFLDIEDISAGGSIISLWTANPKMESPGIVSFSGGAPGGFSGDGLLAKILIQGKKIGSGQMRFLDNTKALLNDGKATPAELSFLEGNFEISAPSQEKIGISSGNCPNYDRWCPWNNLDFFWELKEGASYSYILSHDFQAAPDNVPEEAVGQIRYQGLEDGVYYFRLIELKNEEPGAEGKFSAMIDTAAPEPFQAQIAEIEGKKYLVFSAVDKMSGVDYYEILEKDGWQQGASPYLLRDPNLSGIIQVKAVDKAKNETIAEYIPSPKPFPWQTATATFAALIMIAWLARKFLVSKS